MSPVRETNPNERLAALLAESGWTNEALAHAVRRIAAESGAVVQTNRSSVTHWVRYGVKPSPAVAGCLAEALSRRLGRTVRPADLGLAEPSGDQLDWHTDTLRALADLRGIEVGVERRRAMEAAAFSAAALSIPGAAWWAEMAERGSARVGGAGPGVRRVGCGDVEAVRETVGMFSRMDQRHGGGHARSAVVQYLTSDVADYARGTFADASVRTDLFSAASEVAYLAGWMAFDDGDHAVAQRHYRVALQLAAEAADGPMAGHVLRAMAHQAVDLGYPQQAVRLSAASLEGDRYRLACPRERALLGVVHARGLAASGRRREAATVLLQAERDLAAADGSDDREPRRVFFFQEASLAHETASALRDMGDLDGAAKQFRCSVRKRSAGAFARTHAVTLGYLGGVQLRQGHAEEACGTWSAALTAMEGVRSGRTRQAAADMRAALSPLRARGLRFVREVDDRAADHLAAHT